MDSVLPDGLGMQGAALAAASLSLSSDQASLPQAAKHEISIFLLCF